MINVNGKAEEAAGTVLDVCRRAGADVPAFCTDARLTRGGHCRACLVEVDGRTVASCATPARDGMRVETETERLAAYRRDLGELMLAESTPGGEVGRTIASWGALGDRYGGHAAETRAEETHPYLRIEPDACIRCRLCLRACEELQGQFVFGFAGRGREAHLVWEGARFGDEPCVSCGACASVCPADAIADVDRRKPIMRESARIVRTTCGYCGVGCQLDVRVAEDRVASIDGARAEVNRGHLCVKGRYAHAFSRHRDRLTTPLVRRNGVLEPASWDEAIAFVARELLARRGHVAALSSSRCTNEENYLLQKWLRTALSTHNVDCCARVCHAPTAAGMRASFGTGAATNSFADIEQADVLLVAGSNATEAHPIVGARLKERALAGAGLVVIDPRRTELAALADVHLQLRPGTNVPLLNSFAHVLIDEGLVDRTFVAGRVEGFEELATFVRDQSPEVLAGTTGVPAELVRQAARLYGGARRPLQVHGLGMTEHLQGSESVMLLCNLALLSGAIGRPGVGVNPLRGQNNVQGAADMGCQPDLLTGYADPRDPDVRARFEGVWGAPLPTDRGLTLPKMYDAIRAGEITAMFIFGEDVVQTDPDANDVERTLRKLELLVVQEIFLSSTADLADVVLPGASFLEKDGTFTNGERRVQRVRRAIDPMPGSRPDWRILCDLMAATGFPQPFTAPSEVMDEIARVAPALAGVSYARLEGDGLQWPVPRADHPGTPILHTSEFPRGKGKLACVEFVPSPALREAPGKLLLSTGRALEHYNSGSMTRRTGNVLIRSEDVLELHPADAEARAIADGAMVAIASEHGEARARAAISDRIARGTAFMTFHFPETGTNRVTTNVLDRLADCPEYKLTAVDVRLA